MRKLSDKNEAKVLAALAEGPKCITELIKLLCWDVDRISKMNMERGLRDLQSRRLIKVQYALRNT